MRSCIFAALSVSVLAAHSFAFNDQDRDGFSDELEAEMGLDPQKSSYFPDSDGDGFADHIEVFYKSGPKNKISHPPFGIPFGMELDEASGYWDTVDAALDQYGHWIILLGDGSVATPQSHYTPIRPIVKVAVGNHSPFQSQYLGIQSDGNIVPLGEYRQSQSDPVEKLPYKLPIRAEHQVTCLDYINGIALKNRVTNQIQLFSFESFYPSTENIHVLTAPGTTIHQADEEWMVARSKDGNVFVMGPAEEISRVDTYVAWATHVFISQNEFIAISRSGRVFRLPNWESYLSQNLDLHFAFVTSSQTRAVSPIPTIFQLINQISGASRITGNHDEIVYEEFQWQNTPRFESALGGQAFVDLPSDGFLFYNPSGWGIAIGEDNDESGIADAWESVYNETTEGFIRQIDLDSDGDGIEDAVESLFGLDVYNPDSDEDGALDKTEFFRSYPATLGSSGKLNPFLQYSLTESTFLTTELASTSGFVNESDVMNSQIVQPDITLSDSTIYMEWSLKESDDLKNWETTENFVIEKELQPGTSFFRLVVEP
ncbi:hypothetical protein DDZ13_00610 [Coraliomargarita sinensis]|uniref:EF-hand domain-containing protein n=1 Tax=Coraliomargarita sinensis TaxID=2174842 RepID=A0A317ZPS0_9BACT|nr:hypothetical protein [Coraliomargarita sinensis]PXA05401.1 hypothetical protein DDZ13_00610 [Coraliomargarita sinensis]